jgi:hypothetical protein
VERKISKWWHICAIIFTVCSFIQVLLTLNPRVTDLEGRVAQCEYRVSAIEIKLDAIIKTSAETNKDVKDLFHLILERHGK